LQIKIDNFTYSLDPRSISHGGGGGGGVWERGEGGAVNWGGGVFDAGCVIAFLAAALSRVMRTAGPIPAVATASMLHSAAVGGFVAGDVGPL